jgi:hypothetical protein
MGTDHKTARGRDIGVAGRVAFVILGSVLKGIPAIVLFGPLMFPSARLVGIHEVHYAVIVILAMGIGLFAPPFGVGYYAARDRPHHSRRRDEPYLALSRRIVLWPRHCRCRALAIDRILELMSFILSF